MVHLFGDNQEWGISHKCVMNVICLFFAHISPSVEARREGPLRVLPLWCVGVESGWTGPGNFF